MGKPAIKYRDTTRDSSFTIPVSSKEADEFFHETYWDELHVRHLHTKLLLAVYTRSQVLAMYCRRKKEQERKHPSGVKFAIFVIVSGH